MSVAYGFDPNVSPIYDDDEQFSSHSVHFSSVETPKKQNPVMDKTLGTTHIYLNNSANDVTDELPSTDPLQYQPGPSESIKNPPVNLDEIIPDSTELQQILSNTKIVLSGGCCWPIRRHLMTTLSELGAEIQNEVDSETTHVVMDRYADEKIIEMAIRRSPIAPSIVDIKWIQDCVDQNRRMEESEYSLVDCHYLKETCRRLSHFHRSEENVDPDETQFLNMSTTNAAELLHQVRKLSERLDALLDEPIIRYAYHSPDCPTRNINRQPTPAPPKEIDADKIRLLIENISNGAEIKRRRSFGGFIYQHRKDKNERVMQVILANKDTRDVWDPDQENVSRDLRGIGNVNLRNDMRKTMARDLPQIWETYQKNANITRNRTVLTSKSKTRKNVNKPKKRPLKPTRADDTDIEMAMASLTISLSPNNDDMPPRRKDPIVVTKSAVINQLLMRDSVDDFISDVSAFRQNPESPAAKNSIVFTGFCKDSSVEKKLKRLARRHKLQVLNEIDEKTTRCVVSRHGKRTLLVLKAICLNLPIVKPQWLEESFEDSRLLEEGDYLFEEWQLVYRQRMVNKRVFDSRIFVADGCVPSTNDICWMIEKCGGKVGKNPEKCSIIVAPDCAENVDFHTFGIPVVTPLFIIDSISLNEVQSPNDYQHELLIEVS